MNCEFQLEDGKYKCTRCGRPSPVIAKRNCQVVEKQQIANEPPSTARQIMNFGKAIVKDIASGFARCTQEEVDTRLEICKACPFYNIRNGKGSCNKCGCPITSDLVYRNKLSHKAESCPVGKW